MPVARLAWYDMVWYGNDNLRVICVLSLRVDSIQKRFFRSARNPEFWG